jgi:hypothetical protein
MQNRMTRMARIAGLGAVTLLGAMGAGACKQGPTPEMAAELEQLRASAAERDRLMNDMAENTRVFSEISAELAKVRVPSNRLKATSESPLRATRDSMMQRLRYITAKVNDSDVKLRESERRIKSLTTLSDSLRATLEATIANFDSTLATQRAELAAAAEQLGLLQAENVALRDTVAHMSERENTVYYVVGTKDELIQRGVIVPEGGSRFLMIFGKRGQTLTPARNLDPSQFTAINKRNVREIPLPGGDGGEYRIVSRQDLGYLETQPDERGRINGSETTLKIAAPEQFWTASKFLIVVKNS